MKKNKQSNVIVHFCVSGKTIIRLALGKLHRRGDLDYTSMKKGTKIWRNRIWGEGKTSTKAAGCSSNKKKFGKASCISSSPSSPYSS